MNLKLGSIELTIHKKDERPQWCRVIGKPKQAKTIRI